MFSGGKRGHCLPLARLFSTNPKKGRGFDPPQIFGPAMETYRQNAAKHRKTPQNTAKHRKHPKTPQKCHKMLQNVAKRRKRPQNAGKRLKHAHGC